MSKKEGSNLAQLRCGSSVTENKTGLGPKKVSVKNKTVVKLKMNPFNFCL